MILLRVTYFAAAMLLTSQLSAVVIIQDDFNDPDGTVVRNTTAPIAPTDRKSVV